MVARKSAPYVSVASTVDLRVTKFGESILRVEGVAVEKFDRDLANLAAAMIETMHANEGVGLAAQQIGRDLMLFVVDLRSDERAVDMNFSMDGKELPMELWMPLVVVNPSVRATSHRQISYEEGCLSFPGIFGNVDRPAAVEVDFQDVRGHPRRLQCDGILARVIQHEFDHLNGILFIDRMEASVRQAIEPEIRRLKRHTRSSLRARVRGDFEGVPLDSITDPPRAPQ